MNTMKMSFVLTKLFAQPLCRVFMVKVSFNQKPYRKSMMQLWNGSVIASPSMETRCIAVEAASCPKLTQGTFEYDFGHGLPDMSAYDQYFMDSGHNDAAAKTPGVLFADMLTS